MENQSTKQEYTVYIDSKIITWIREPYIVKAKNVEEIKKMLEEHLTIGETGYTPPKEFGDNISINDDLVYTCARDMTVIENDGEPTLSVLVDEEEIEIYDNVKGFKDEKESNSEDYLQIYNRRNR